MDIKETEWKHTDWNCLAENRDKCCTLGNMVMELWVSQSVGGGISWLANLPKKDCTTKLVGLFHPSFPSASYSWFRTFWMWETQGPCQPLSYQCWYWSPSYIYLGHQKHKAPASHCPISVGTGVHLIYILAITVPQNMLLVTRQVNETGTWGSNKTLFLH